MQDTLIGSAFYQKNELTKAEIESIQSAFVLTDRKISKIDYRYNITKIYEIAARALSSGVNDPNTAIHCIYKIGVLLSPLAKINQYNIQSKWNEKVKIFYTSYKFEEDLERYYVPLINYATEDVMVIKSIINSLNIMKALATEENINEIISNLTESLKKRAETITKSVDKNAISEAVSKNTELSDAEAKEAVDNIYNGLQTASTEVEKQLNTASDKIEEAKVDIQKAVEDTKETAGEVSDTIAKTSLWTFLGLLAAMILTIVAGAKGSRYAFVNDEERM